MPASRQRKSSDMDQALVEYRCTKIVSGRLNPHHLVTTADSLFSRLIGLLMTRMKLRSACRIVNHFSRSSSPPPASNPSLPIVQGFMFERVKGGHPYQLCPSHHPRLKSMVTSFTSSEAPSLPQGLEDLNAIMLGLHCAPGQMRTNATGQVIRRALRGAKAPKCLRLVEQILNSVDGQRHTQTSPLEGEESGKQLPRSVLGPINCCGMREKRVELKDSMSAYVVKSQKKK